MDKTTEIGTVDTLSRRGFLRLAGTSFALWAIRRPQIATLERMALTGTDKYNPTEAGERLEKYGLGDFLGIAETARRIYRTRGFIPDSWDPMIYYPTLAHMGANLDGVDLSELTSGWNETPWQKQLAIARHRVSAMKIAGPNSDEETAEPAGIRFRLQTYAEFFRTQTIFLPKTLQILSPDDMARTGGHGFAGNDIIYLGHPDSPELFASFFLHESRHYFKEQYRSENRKYLERKRYAAGKAVQLEICDEVFGNWLALDEKEAVEKPIIRHYLTSAQRLANPNPVMVEQTHNAIVDLARAYGLLKPDDNLTFEKEADFSKLLNTVGHRFFKKFALLNEVERAQLVRDNDLAKLFTMGTYKEFPGIRWVVIENAMSSIDHALFTPPLIADLDVARDLRLYGNPLITKEHLTRSALAFINATTYPERKLSIPDIREKLGLEPTSLPVNSIGWGSVAGLGVVTATLYCLAGITVLRDRLKRK